MQQLSDQHQHPIPTVEVSSAALQHIQQNLKQVQQNLHRVEQMVADNELHPAQKREEGKASSRVILAMIVGAVGAVIGGFVGKRFSNIKSFVMHDLLKFESKTNDLLKNRLQFDFFDKNDHKRVGNAIGGALGAITGWNGGGRIENPADIFMKPIVTLGKIFTPEPQALHPDHNVLPPNPQVMLTSAPEKSQSFYPAPAIH